MTAAAILYLLTATTDTELIPVFTFHIDFMAKFELVVIVFWKIMQCGHKGCAF